MKLCADCGIESLTKVCVDCSKKRSKIRVYAWRAKYPERNKINNSKSRKNANAKKSEAINIEVSNLIGVDNFKILKDHGFSFKKYG